MAAPPGKVQITIEGVGDFFVDEGYSKLSPQQQESWKNELRTQVQRAPEPPSMSVGDYGMDVLKQSGAGLAEGTAYLGGAPGDVQSFVKGGASFVDRQLNRGVNFLSEKTGVPAPSGGVSVQPPVALSPQLPTSGDITSGIEGVTGKFPEAETTPGAYARAISRWVPAAALGPGSLARRGIGYALTPGFFEETVGRYAKQYGPKAEAVARALGGLGGLGLGMLRAPRQLRTAYNTLADQLLPDSERRLAQLGPEAILGEASPGMTGVTQGLASRPSTMNAIREVLERRRAGANARLQGDVNANLGMSPLLAVEGEAIQANLRNIGQDYPAVIGQPGAIVNPQGVVGILDNMLEHAKGPIADKLRSARSMLYTETQNAQGQTVRILDQSPQGLHNTRQAIDQMIAQAGEGTPLAQRLGEVRRAVDDELAQLPGMKDLDARYAEMKGQQEALDTGGTVLGTGKEALHPRDLVQRITAMSADQRRRLWQGARAEIERILGTKSNDVVAMRNMIQGESDWNREKLIRLFGRDRAQAVFDAVEREVAFANTFNRVVENSQTAQRLAGQRLVDQSTGGVNVPPIWERIGQIPEQTLRAIINALSRGALNTRDIRMSSAVSLQGAERDALIRELRRRAVMQPTRAPSVPMSMVPIGALRPPQSSQ